MRPSLSLLCVTKGEAQSALTLCYLHLLAERLGCKFVVAADGPLAMSNLEAFFDRTLIDVVGQVQSQGYLESVLDASVALCDTDYILRIDDDETCSPAMVDWLEMGLYRTSDHWKFPRQHLWGDDSSVLLTPHLFPDHQTRLSTKEKSGGRYHVHAGSPFGGGELAPVAILHYKFLNRSIHERYRIARTYDRQCEGFGTGNMFAFSCPELAYTEEVRLVEGGDGSVPWTPSWVRDIRLSEESPNV